MTFYTAVKIVHVLSIISWMAAILYLPRLFVYHSDTDPQSDTSRLLSVMERRLLRGIMTPAMIAAWLTGGWLAVTGGFTHDIWFMVKFAAVLLMSGMHGFLSRERKLLELGQRPHTSRFYRLINEVPTLLMIVIVTMVLAKPF
ncbi:MULTISPECIES: CopD family protein [unclassified Beijerinckia]|uniref:CopD family protein n=1 Tax=unclassified Beijerinckia TaxID=2638183 RepID=UPI0008966E40|nr:MULTISPECIES: CopD family protein [unclassified Beijerinckia]MDH7797999.1 putative membrane protein [Beijerinckia sp. GAS462]SED05509.1 putative membrane protein [Beijerinckia sp. 28-YEA-48]